MKHVELIRFVSGLFYGDWIEYVSYRERKM